MSNIINGISAGRMSNIITANITKQPLSPARFRYSSEIDGSRKPCGGNTLLNHKEAFIEVEMAQYGNVYRHRNVITVKVYPVNAHPEEDGSYLPHVNSLYGPNCSDGYYKRSNIPGNQPIRIPHLQVVQVKKRDEKTYEANLKNCISNNLDIKNKLPALVNLPIAELQKKFSTSVRFCVQIELTGPGCFPILAYTDLIFDVKRKPSKRQHPEASTGSSLRNSDMTSYISLADNDQYGIERKRVKKRNPKVYQILKISNKKTRLDSDGSLVQAGGSEINIHESVFSLQPTQCPQPDLPCDPTLETPMTIDVPQTVPQTGTQSPKTIDDTDDPWMKDINTSVVMTDSEANQLKDSVLQGSPSTALDFDIYLKPLTPPQYMGDKSIEQPPEYIPQKLLERDGF